MPPTHPSQADVAAAYRTLIAHETEPKEQDFYRTRLQRLEQATESVCEFDCRSRVAAAGVGVYCPQCSAKSADTDLTTQLAIQQIEGEAAWWRNIDFDRNASRTFDSMTGDSQQAVRTGVERVLSYLQSTGRLLADDEMPLTAEQVEDVRTAREGLRGYRNFDGNARGRVNRLIAAVDALFPATEPAEAATNSMLKVPASDEFSGNNVAECNSSTGGEDVQAKKITRAWMQHLGYSEDHVDSLEQATHEGYGCEHNPLGGWDCIDESGDSQHQDWDEYDNTAQIVMFVLERIPVVTSAEPAEEETKAESHIEKSVRKGALAKLLEGILEADDDGWHLPNGWFPTDLAEAIVYAPASSPVVPAPTETGPWATWESVPDDVWFTSASAVGFLPAHRKRGSLVDWQFRDGSVGVYDVSRIGNGKLMARAPFVAAEEGWT